MNRNSPKIFQDKEGTPNLNELSKKRLAPSSSSKISFSNNEPAAKRSKSITLETQNTRPKQDSFNNLIKPSESTFKKRHMSSSPSSSSSSSLSSHIEVVDVDVPCSSKNNNLNCIDAEKRKYLNSHKLKNPSGVLSNKPPPAIEALKKLKCIESAKYLAQKPKKRKESIDLNLTQATNIAKVENLARLNERVNEMNKLEKNSNVNKASSSVQAPFSNHVTNLSKPVVSKNSEETIFASVVNKKPPIPKPSTPQSSSAKLDLNPPTFRFKSSVQISSSKATSSNNIDDTTSNSVEITTFKSNEACSFVRPSTKLKEAITSTKPKEATSSTTNGNSSKITTDLISKKTTEVIEGNGVLGDIMNLMNINHINLNNASANNQRNPIEVPYSLEDFFGRINKWNYKWIEEQEKIDKERQKFNLPPIVDYAKHLPPIVEFTKEIFPVVDYFNTFKDYYKTMMPYLLLETWEEIRQEMREQRKKAIEKKTYQNSLMWLKSLEKINENTAIKIIFQSKSFFKYKCGNR